MKDLRLDCNCYDPFCFVCLRWEPEFILDKPIRDEHITVFYKEFNGRFWRRVKTAIHLIFKGEWTKEADVCLEGPENLDKLSEWCKECLEERDERKRIQQG